MKKRLNQKIIAIIVGATVLAIGVNQIVDILSITSANKAVITEFEHYKKLNETQLQKLNKIEGLVDKNTDLTYYASNIYAYAMLEGFSVQVNVDNTKYKNTLPININFTGMKNTQQLKDFLIAMNTLGTVENLTSKSLTLHVYPITIQKAKQIIQKEIENNKKEIL